MNETSKMSWDNPRRHFDIWTYFKVDLYSEESKTMSTSLVTDKLVLLQDIASTVICFSEQYDFSLIKSDKTPLSY